MRLCWLRTRPGSSHVGRAAPGDTLPLLGEGPDAALGKEAEMLYRGTSPIKKCHALGSYSRSMPGTLQKSWGKGVFYMSEVLLYHMGMAPVTSLKL